MTALDSTLRRLRPPSPDAWGRGVTLAVLVHAALIVALAFGVSWRSSTPAGVEAELWAAVPQIAAPKVEAPPPPKPEPVVTPKVEAPPPPPKEVEPPKPTEAEIAIERAKREKLLREQQEEQDRRERDEQRKRREAEDKKKAEQQQREAQRKREEQERRDEQRLAKLREDNLARMREQAGTGGAGTAARSAGPSAAYAGRIAAKVKPNIFFGDEIAGNPPAEVEVRAAADGTILGRRLVKSSGVKAWDEAVLRAIDKTETLPRDTDGRVPSSITIEFRPKD